MKDEFVECPVPELKTTRNLTEFLRQMVDTELENNAHRNYFYYSRFFCYPYVTYGTNLQILFGQPACSILPFPSLHFLLSGNNMRITITSILNYVSS